LLFIPQRPREQSRLFATSVAQAQTLRGDPKADGWPRSLRQEVFSMKQLTPLVSLGFALAVSWPGPAFAQRSQYEEMVSRHAQANGVPVELVHRVIVRESRYRPGLVGHGGAVGMMQIKLATARGLGYTGTAEGLRDPETNLTYAVKYLAGAYRAANGDQNRAVAYYAGGYYYVAKRQRAESRVPDRVRSDVMPR
jgi:soluble lytic murein transglycosylase-like protein